MTLPGPPTQHGIYANPEWTGQPYPSLGWQNIRQDQEPPEGWPRPPKFNEPGDVPGPPVQYGDPITPQTVKAGYGFIDNGIIEKNLYFYHPDHLGSSSYITDREGRITQHTEYIAFGEVLFEEHSTSRTMPYLFNGKELDTETGLYYYGARYYDPRVSLWLNTDPLSGYNPIQETEHYIDGQHNGGIFNPMNHNTYGYTYNNPIVWMDPNGKQVFVVHGTTQTRDGHTFSQGALNEFKRIGGNSYIDTGFRWNAPINNNPITRNQAGRNLITYVLNRRAELIKAGIITNSEPITLLGYSHGGNVSFNGVETLSKQLGVKINLITVSTPVRSNQSEQPINKKGINEHIQIVHENDGVTSFWGGDADTFNTNTPHKTTNYVIPQKEIDLKGSIESHTDLPGHPKFPNYLKKIPRLSNPKPIKNEN